MSIVIEKLVSRGVGQPEAAIEFGVHRTLIRGPSDTGKSYIRDCLWYLLGGDRVPKEIPEAKGYDTLLLQFRTGEGGVYTVRRALNGGGAAVYAAPIDELEGEDSLPDDIGELLVAVAGADGKQILRSMSKRGPVTGGDLRHWFLLSQPAMISESTTTGNPTEQPQRRAAFNLFLTGNDDASVVLASTAEEKHRLKGELMAIERDMERVKRDLPSERTRKDVQDALERVDGTLSLLSQQQNERSVEIRRIREDLANVSGDLAKSEARLSYASAMVSRFTMLDEKYASDIARLSAVDDSLAVIGILENQPCPLCGTPSGAQVDVEVISDDAIRRQRRSMTKEAEKIAALRVGLKIALANEREAVTMERENESVFRARLGEISLRERKVLANGIAEFSASPKELAVARTDLASQLSFFDEYTRLTAEYQRLKNRAHTKPAPLSRASDAEAMEAAAVIRELLHSWGFQELRSVELDPTECDIKIDGRYRLTYGAGKRAIFLAAMVIGLLKHSMTKGYPHLGTVVIDSPLKSYADPKNTDVTASPTSVRDAFYAWLAAWDGPGQVVVLENEPVKEETGKLLVPTEFIGRFGEGRRGFYLTSVDAQDTNK